jgi:hypothetical protein
MPPVFYFVLLCDLVLYLFRFCLNSNEFDFVKRVENGKPLEFSGTLLGLFSPRGPLSPFLSSLRHFPHVAQSALFLFRVL